ncbi:MAG: DUF4129 domain-containing protein [Candidatus Bipolaricaulia bacterium]
MDRRRWTIGGAIALTVLALAALASGLSSVDLGSGTPLPSVEAFEFDSSPGAPAQGGTLPELVIRIVFAIVFWVLLPISLLYLLVSAKARRILLRNLAVFAMLLLMFYLIVQLADNRAMNEAREPAAPRAGENPGAATRPVDPPDYVSQPPDWIILAVSGVIFAVIGLVAWRLWTQRTDPQAEETELEDELAQRAGAALDDIRSGQAFSNVVIRCYWDMERSVRRAQGLSRRASMTPREFERRLVQAGLDAEAVRGLTRLFERVRYGNEAVDPNDEAEAEACLAAIAGRVGSEEPA